MRVNVEIDDALMAEAMEATGKTTRRATVEAALRALIRLNDPKYDAAVLRRLRSGENPTPPWHDRGTQSRN